MVGSSRGEDSRSEGGRFFGELQRNPLAGTQAAVFVLGGDIFRLLERVKEAGRRTPVCINVDLGGGVSADASGLRFLSGRIEGVISTHRHVIELARETDLLTVHRLFAIDSGAVERGVKLIRRAQPHCVEILPALAYPKVTPAYPELLKRPAWLADSSKAWKTSPLYSRRVPPESRRATRSCSALLDAHPWTL